MEGLVKKILVADDDVELKNIVKSELSEYSIDTVSNAPEALEAIKHNNYDLILTDNQMLVYKEGKKYDYDHNSGLSLIKGVRESNKDVPIVFYTSGPEVDHFFEALIRGANQVHSKSELNEVYRTIRQCLN